MITLGTTYYNNPELLLNLINTNMGFVDEIIVVDDGSKPEKTITNFVSPNKVLKLFRVKKDYGFNSHGCRNLIMSKAKNDWVALIDIDRTFIYPDQAYNTMYGTNLKNNVRYRFITHVKPNYKPHISVNDFLINKELFFKAGGYDEELIGHRTGDRQFFKQLLHFGTEKTMHGVDILMMRNASSFLKNDALSPFDKKRLPKNLEKLLKDRIKTPASNKKILTFEWEQIT